MMSVNYDNERNYDHFEHVRQGMLVIYLRRVVGIGFVTNVLSRMISIRCSLPWHFKILHETMHSL